MSKARKKYKAKIYGWQVLTNKKFHSDDLNFDKKSPVVRTPQNNIYFLGNLSRNELLLNTAKVSVLLNSSIDKQFM
jgi:hypothetical protein